jgi:hypothetical protein
MQTWWFFYRNQVTPRIIIIFVTLHFTKLLSLNTNEFQVVFRLQTVTSPQTINNTGIIDETVQNLAEVTGWSKTFTVLYVYPKL